MPSRSHLEGSRLACREAKVPKLKVFQAANRDNGPASAGSHATAEPSITCAHDGLIAMLHLKFVEDPRYVIADGLLRQPKRARNVSVVHPACDPFEDSAFTRRKVVER